MSKLKTLVVVILLINVTICSAQLDSTRMKTFNSKLQVGLFLADNNATNIFTNSQGETYTQTMALKPTLGFQVAYNGAILALGTGVPIPNGRYSYDSSSTINIAGYFSRPKYVLWGAARRFQGLLNEEGNVVENSEYENLTGSFMYIFSENDYSFRAAFRQVDQQLTSGGSWLAKGVLSYTNIYDSTLLVLGNEDFAGLRTQGISLFGGYAYTLNFNENWFISALLLGGIDYQIASSNNPNALLTEKAPITHSLAPTYDFKASVGYNSDRFYISILFAIDNRLAVNDIEGIDFEHQFLRTDLRFGTRINAPKIIQKIGFLNR